MFSPIVRRFVPVAGASPAVAVVMTCFNDQRFLEEAVQGVLGQSFTDFEFIVVDNGSDDPGAIRALAARDPRVRVLRVETNLGSTGGGNFGIGAARAPIIARMDADDVAETGWLAAVMEAFTGDDELGLIGTWVNLITEHGDPIGIDRTAESDFAIRFTMLSHNPFYHSSTAYRRELFDLVYESEADRDLAYELWLWRAMLPHCRVRNLPQPLVRYRYNSQGLTGTENPVTARARTRSIRLGLWRELGLDLPLEDQALAECFDDFLRGRPCRHPRLWPELRRVVELAIAATTTREDSLVRPGEEAEQRAFLAELAARLDRGPKLPPGRLRRSINALRLRGPGRTLAAALRKVSDRR